MRASGRSAPPSAAHARRALTRIAAFAVRIAPPPFAVLFLFPFSGRVQISAPIGCSTGPQLRGLAASNNQLFERHNDNQAAELLSKVGMLKTHAINIDGEIRDQNALLDRMGDQFYNSNSLLSQTSQRLGSMLAQGGTRYMCTLTLFVVFIVLVVYYLVRAGFASKDRA